MKSIKHNRSGRIGNVVFIPALPAARGRLGKLKTNPPVASKVINYYGIRRGTNPGGHSFLRNICLHITGNKTMLCCRRGPVLSSRGSCLFTPAVSSLRSRDMVFRWLNCSPACPTFSLLHSLLQRRRRPPGRTQNIKTFLRNLTRIFLSLFSIEGT